MYKKLILTMSGFVEKVFPKNHLIDGRYRVLMLLGTGSYGHSYQVLDKEKNVIKVLKTLRIHKRISTSGRNGFKNEIKFLTQINHPGFPAFYESGSYGKIPYYTMEYIEGKNFEQLIFKENRKFTEHETFKIVRELLHLIDYLHRIQMIHRDIRIPNVMFDGIHVRLVDFGLAIQQKRKKISCEKKFDSELRKLADIGSDFYGLGHFILFLLYSSWSTEKDVEEKSWEEELNITLLSKQTIRKLLQIETPYDGCGQILMDVEKIIVETGRKNNVIL